jgi:hypothetical protein
MKGDDAEDTEARRKMHNLLRKKEEHPYDR